MAETLAQQIGLNPVGSDEYVSTAVPARMGNRAPIAYGGVTMGVAVHAACLTVSSTHHLYSVVGHYLGPASLTSNLTCKVERTRDTRTFATRRVQVLQEQPDGKTRVCMDLLADFQVKEPSFMVYSAPSTRPYPAAEDCPSTAEHKEALLSSGKSNAKHAEIYETAFRLMESYFEIRRCVDGIASQNWNGIAKHTVTTQDHLPITSKTTAEWYRLRQNPGTEPQQMAALAFIMDAALSFIPLTHDHKFLDDVGACSSLDFALRVFVNADEVDLQNWALIERQTSVANAGRTYSENRCWDADGRMIASMTQQSIMRVKPGSRASL